MTLVTTKVTPTECKIAEMLLENTGSHFLDSGGAYGRAWQHARAKYGLNPSKNSWYSGSPLGPDPDPDEDTIERVARMMLDEPEGYIDSYGVVTIDTFHWLRERIEYDPPLDAKFQRWVRLHNAAVYAKDPYSDDLLYGMARMVAFLDLLHRHEWNRSDERIEVSGGVYPGEGHIDNCITNTYNGEDALDRTLQFAHFHVGHKSGFGYDGDFLPEGSYVLLQIHGGADVRGGYTEPVLFRSYGEQADLYDNDRVYVWCEGNEEYVVPDHQIDGQVTMEGEILQGHTIQHAHRWDNTYGDGHLRLTYNDGEDLDWYGPDKQEHVLVFCRDDDKIEDTIATSNRYVDGNWIPDKTAIADNATMEQETDDSDIVTGHWWKCPFDGSRLRAGGACVG